MKHLLYNIPVLAAIALLWCGCEREMEFSDTAFSPVETLLYPADGYALDLINKDFANLTFEWEPSATGKPSYSVVFYASDGTTEIGRYISNDSGAKSLLTMSHPDLVELAEISGIEPEGTGDLYWTVCAASGANIQDKLPAARKLTVTRDNTPVKAPYSLYITGAGSESGADITSAAQMMSTGDDKFEIVSRISGDFHFVNRAAEGSKREFYVTSDGKLTSNAENASKLENGIYLIEVDFGTNSVEFTSISDVELHRANGELLAQLAYAGNGTWTVSDYTIPTSGDDRYRFLATMNGKQVIWGSSRTDRDASDPGTVDSENSYFNIYVVTAQANLDDSYRSCFKFHSPIKGLKCSISINTNRESWNHTFDFGFDIEAVPTVSTLNTPAKDASVSLQTLSGAAMNFSWTSPESSPQLALTSYSVVFFSDAEGTSRISSVSAGYNTSVSITHRQLEEIAASAKIEAEGTGTIYWGVETSLIGNTAMSEEIRSLSITRMAGIPASMYLTGAATEFGSGYGIMRTVNTGEYEIFTELTSGQSYSFTDKNDGTGRKFSINGTAFSETSSTSTWSGSTGIYRITLSYMDNTAKVESIGRVWMEVCAYKSSNFTLNYDGNGIWTSGTITPDFTREPSWNGDTRFFVKMEIDGETWKLAHQKDFGGSDPTTPAAEGDERYWITFWDDASDWDYHYKVIQAYRGQNTKSLNLKVNLTSTVENPYVYIDFLNL